MSRPRKYFAMFIILLTAFCFAIESVAHKIDGNVDDTSEWAGRPFLNVADNKDTGCNEEFIFFRHEFRPDKKILYISFQCVEYKNVVDINNCAFEIEVNDFSPIAISFSDMEYDEELFKVSSAWSEQIDGESMEAKITFLRNVGDKLNFRFSVTDSHGIKSKQYSLTIDEYTKTTTTASTTKADKTTSSKTKTTKAAQTKWTTAVYSTVNIKDYTSSDNSYKTVQNNATQSESEVTTESDTSVQSQTQNNGRIVMKTVSIGIIVVAGVAFVTVLMNRKKQ